MGNDFGRRIGFFCFSFFLLFSNVTAQDGIPSQVFQSKDKTHYNIELKKIESAQLSPKIALRERKKLAAKYHNQSDLIAVLEEELRQEGDSAPLRYQLGGANGLYALSISKMLSLPYVRAMLRNFDAAIQLDSLYTPAYEAAIRAHYMVPSLIGGDKKKAQLLIKKLKSFAPIQGALMQAYGLEKEGFALQAKKEVEQAFAQWDHQFGCDQNLNSFFSKTSMNFPLEMALFSTRFGVHPVMGLCMVNYFITEADYRYTVSLEWAYFIKFRLEEQVGEKQKANEALQKALEINPTFDIELATKKIAKIGT